MFIRERGGKKANCQLIVLSFHYPFSLPKNVSHSFQFLSIKLQGWQGQAQQEPATGNRKPRGEKNSWNKCETRVFSSSHGKQIIFAFYFLTITSCKHKNYITHPQLLKDVLQQSFGSSPVGILCAVTFDLAAAAANVTLFHCYWYQRH